MTEPRKKPPKSLLEQVPTRKLISSIKRDIRRQLRSAPAPKPKKK